MNKRDLVKMVKHLWSYYESYKKDINADVRKKVTLREFMLEFLGEYEDNVL